jgi:hypothetical protein
MALKAKKKGAGFEMRTFTGKSGTSYLVFKTSGGAYHAFAETEAKTAAQDCAAEPHPRTEKNTRYMWDELWKGRNISN